LSILSRVSWAPRCKLCAFRPAHSAGPAARKGGRIDRESCQIDPTAGLDIIHSDR
jgi:hypothetical protein